MRHTALTVGLLVLVGCAPQEPASEIVRRVEAAGAGEMKTASKEAITGWLGRNPQVAADTHRDCQPVRQKASANWADTTEGRVCAAAAEAVVFRMPDALPKDERTFKGGAR